MQFFNIKTNKIYNFLYEMPLENKKNTSKDSSNKFPREYDHNFNFYLKGKQISVSQIQKLYNSKPKDQLTIIVKKKSLQRKIDDTKNLYDSHRNKIEGYLQETKENDVQAIKQNAEFIFNKAIDGNFQFKTFENYDYETQFTEERKNQLLNEIYEKICQDPHESIDIIDWSKKESDPKISSSSASKKLQKIEQKAEESNQSDQEKGEKRQQIKEIDRKSSEKRQKPNELQKQKRINLELHELMYMTENWKLLNMLNKDLMNNICDNIKYYENQRGQNFQRSQKLQKEMEQKDIEI